MRPKWLKKKTAFNKDVLEFPLASIQGTALTSAHLRLMYWRSDILKEPDWSRRCPFLMPWHKFFKYQSTPGISRTYNTRIDAQFAETANVVQRLFDDQKKQKLPFSISVFSKQSEVCRFRFPFAANELKLPFSSRSIFRITCIYTYTYTYIIYILHCRFKRKTEIGRPGVFP